MCVPKGSHKSEEQHGQRFGNRSGGTATGVHKNCLHHREDSQSADECFISLTTETLGLALSLSGEAGLAGRALLAGYWLVSFCRGSDRRVQETAAIGHF